MENTIEQHVDVGVVENEAMEVTDPLVIDFLNKEAEKAMGKQIALRASAMEQADKTQRHFTKLGPAKSYLKSKKVNAGLIEELLRISFNNPDPMSIAGKSNPMSDMIAPAIIKRAPPATNKFFKENHIYNLVCASRDKEKVLWIIRPSRGELYMLQMEYVQNGVRHTLPELLTIYLANYLHEREADISRMSSEVRNPL